MATKVGLEWDPAKTKVWRNSSRDRILKKIEDSLRRLPEPYALRTIRFELPRTAV